MAIIKPFKGIRPQKGYEDKVASKPYDVLNSAEARREAEGNPHSFLHVIKSEIDLPEDLDVYDQSVYDKARDNFYKFLDEKILIEDAKPCMYLYQQVSGEWEQTGLVACSSVEDYFNDVIKKHEFTTPQMEQDRITHMKVTGIHSGPVFMTYPAVNEIDNISKEIISSSIPVYDFEANDKVRHTLWVIDDDEKIEKLVSLFADVPATYIADGHHRAASSAKVSKAAAEENGHNDSNAEYNFFLTVLFPADQVHIIDYNRLVKDLNGMSTDEFLQGVEEKFLVEDKGSDPYKPQRLHEFGMYLDKKWYKLTARESAYDDNDPIGVLDVTVLQYNLLDELLGIKDQRTDSRIDFVGGVRGLEGLAARVDSGEMKIAFALYPVTIQQLMDIADTGKVMPPKSTWFEPKLRSGLIVHRFA